MLGIDGYLEHYGIVLTPTDKEDGKYQRYDILVVDDDQYYFFCPELDYIAERITNIGDWYDATSASTKEYINNLFPKNVSLVMLQELEKEYTYE